MRPTWWPDQRLAAPACRWGWAPQRWNVRTVHAAANIGELSAERSGVPPWQEKSKAIPFLPAAPALDGTMAGDKGFDPLLLSNIVPLKWAREVRSVAVALLPLRGRASRGSGLTLSGSACRRS